MSEAVFLAWVPASAMGSSHLLAMAVCNHARRNLGLGDVAIRWLAPGEEGRRASFEEAGFRKEDNFWGMVRATHPGTIFLRAGLTLSQVIETAAHECRHLFQVQQHGSWEGWWMDCRSEHDRAEQEADANAYAERFARELGWGDVVEIEGRKERER